MFGDGSDGALNVASGTHNLPLNTKHQFTTVNIAAGATLSTTSTTGAVLYILARDSITIDGSINVSGKVDPGNNTWTVILDGVSYSSPGVANGAYWTEIGQSGTGFGAGGRGGGVDSTPGGAASQGGPSPSGGAGAYRYSGTNQSGYTAGDAGVQSAGGGGSAWSSFTQVSGTVTGFAIGQGGNGATTFGGNGADGSGTWSTTGGSGTFQPRYYGGGGGGGGGIAGRAGVHVVLKAPSITFNGTIITSGTDGGNGGNGGRAQDNNGWRDFWGNAGLGGGGGKGGNVTLVYASALEGSGTTTRAGGTGGSNGFGGAGYVQPANKGANGSSGSLSTQQITDPSLYTTYISPTGIASNAAVGSPTITPGTAFISPTGIASRSSFGTPKMTLYTSGFGGIAPVAAVGAPVLTQSPPPPPPPTDWSAVGKQDEKVYTYKVTKHDGTFIGVWTDVVDDLQFTERINTPGTTTTIKLGRSANTKREVRDNIVTQAGDTITAEDSSEIVATGTTSNTVGEDTDVDLNYNVDIYVHYGEFVELITQAGDTITTEDGDTIMVVSGAPLGTRIFSGYVLDYDAAYGDESGVSVTVASNGYELSDALVVSGSDTTVTYSSTELATMVKNVLNINPGRMGYSTASIADTAVSQTMKFQLNTKLESIQAVHDQTPSGWWWRGDVAENLVYMQPLNTGFDHTFVLGWHIKSVDIKRSMEALKNLVYFVGGQTDPADVSTMKFKKYQDTDSQDDWRVGLERITDRRYTVDASMLARANKVLNTYGNPAYSATVTITSGRYDIESIRVGQTVGFMNFGNYIDGVPPMQIISRQYTPTAVVLDLGAALDRQVDTLSETEKALNNEAYQNLPMAPS